MSLENLQRSLSGDARHFSPFFMLGDPDPETSLALLRAAAEAGVTMLEVGIPFSDPVADGPAIQAASERALRAGTTPSIALRILGELRATCDIPFNLLVYGNLIHARGYERFARDAVAAGASSVLAPDIPFEESAPLARATERADLGLVHLIGPATSVERAAHIARHTTGFLYVAGHQGITGAALRTRTEKLVELRNRTSCPLAVGFGLTSPQDVSETLRAGAQIAIVGSALARILSTADSPIDAVTTALGAYVTAALATSNRQADAPLSLPAQGASHSRRKG